MNLQEFKEKVLPAKDKLHRLAFRLLKSPEEAQDSVQDAFLKLWDMRADLGNYRSVEALAMTITKNLCLDKLKAKRNQNLTLDNHSHHMISDARSPDHRAELNNSAQIVAQAMETLPDQQKMILQFRDIEEMDFAEIAEIMDLEINNIRVNLSRARKKIREILHKAYNYGI